MREVQVASESWLLVDDLLRVRYSIRYEPMVQRETRETASWWRLERWALVKEKRYTVGIFEGHPDAIVWAHWLDDVDEARERRPDMTQPLDMGYAKSPIPPDEQERRWEAGLDPETGEPRPTPRVVPPPKLQWPPGWVRDAPTRP